MSPKLRISSSPWFGMDDDGFLHVKRVDENWALTFDFAKRMASDETVNSATWVCSVQSGVDASASSMISGSTTNSGTKSTQLVIDGVDGVTYVLVCTLTTSAQVLHGVGLMMVSNKVRGDGTIR